MKMNEFKTGDIAIAQNGDRGIFIDDSFMWAGSDHEPDDIAFLIRYTDTGAEIHADQTDPAPDFLPELEIGSKGLMVLLAQTALKCKGYYRGNLDGDFGKMTYDAVRRFREDNYLTGDTIIDKQTYQFLFKE